jgi:hypothetical protein
MKNMNTKIITSLIGTSLALAVAVLIWTPASSSAQGKGAQLLIQRAAPASTAPAVAVAPAVSCPECATQFTTRTDATVRGAIKPTVITAKHLCGSCDTSVKTTQTGKHAVDVTLHTCATDATTAVSCCK